MSDRWLPEGQDPREAIETGSGEKAVVLGYLEHYRMTFELKCEGLDTEQLARRSVPPSALSLLGLLRHLAKVEHSWSRRVLEGHGDDLPQLFADGAGGNDDFAGAVADDAVVAEAWAVWRSEVQHAREVEVGLDFDAVVQTRTDQVEVRDVMVHLVEEYARHCGHADLLRECIDGRVGQ